MNKLKKVTGALEKKSIILMIMKKRCGVHNTKPHINYHIMAYIHTDEYLRRDPPILDQLDLYNKVSPCRIFSHGHTPHTRASPTPH